MTLQHAYIDGDILVHRAIWNSSRSDVKRKINIAIVAIMEHLELPVGRIAIRGPDNFRKTRTNDYKANRKKDDDPKKLELMILAYEHLKEHWGAEEATGMEADDLLAIWQTETPGVIVSVDKDMLQVPGWHYNTRTNNYREVSEEEASLLLHTQMLTGDSTDNIKGLHGIGPVKAKRILAGVPAKNHLSHVRAAWQKHHGQGWEAALQLCTDLVYLRRSEGDQYVISQAPRAPQEGQVGEATEC